MTTPAQKCAERIVADQTNLDSPEEAVTHYTSIIQSEYAETFKTAREAIEFALTLLLELGNAQHENQKLKVELDRWKAGYDGYRTDLAAADKENQMLREALGLSKKAMPPCRSEDCSPSDETTWCHRCRAVNAIQALATDSGN